jgi:hypothetical protein
VDEKMPGPASLARAKVQPRFTVILSFPKLLQTRSVQSCGTGKPIGLAIKAGLKAFA